MYFLISVNHCFFIDQTDSPGSIAAIVVLAITTVILFCLVMFLATRDGLLAVAYHKLDGGLCRQRQREEQPLVQYDNTGGGGGGNDNENHQNYREN